MPSHLGQGPGAGGRTDGLSAGRCAGFHALGNPLEDGREAKQVIGQVKIPVSLERLGCGEAGALSVLANVIIFQGDTQAGNIQPANAAKRTRRNMPGHAVVAEIGQRVAQR